MRPNPAEGGGGAGSRPLPVAAIVAARNEVDRISATLDALSGTFPGADLIVADDASTDGTPLLARRWGARVVSRQRSRGKGGNVTAAAESLLAGEEPGSRVVLLCDADLGESAARLGPLVDAVARAECDLAIAGFATRRGGGFGIALGFSRWAVRRLTGLELAAPISGQRAMRDDVLRDLLPFAPGFGIETAMDIDAARAGYRISEVEIDLEHRHTGRTPRGFLHRGRQLWDFLRVYMARRRERGYRG